jgi:ActR/RegA family two-component response regulator
LSAAASPLCIVFVVHGDAEFCAAARRRLLKRSFAARVAGHCAVALDLADRRGCDIAVIKWPGRSAGTVALVKPVRTAPAGIQIVRLIGHSSIERCVAMMLADVDATLREGLQAPKELSPN